MLLNRPRTSGQASLRVALLLLLAVSTAVTAAEVVLVRAAYPPATWPGYTTPLSSYPLVGLAAVVVGLLAWDRRPSNRTGPLLCVAGGLVLAAAAGNVADPDIALVGAVLGPAPIAAILHLLLAFPSGRLRGRVDRALVVASYLVTVGLMVPQAVPALAPAAEDAHRVQSVLGFVVTGLAALLLVPRLRTARTVTGERRVLARVYAYGIGLLLFFPVTAQVVRPALGLSAISLFALQLCVLVTMPFVFAAGVLRGGFARTGEVEELGAWLGTSDGARPPLRDALATTLGDDSLQLLFRRPGSHELIDPEGRPAVLEVPAGRARVDIAGVGGPAATVVYDATLLADPELVASAGRVVALVLERERLTAELLASREDVRRSRARIVEVADQERRRFAQDLHDLLQSRLLLAALQAGRLAAEAPDETTRQVAAQLRGELEGAINEFRRLVHGVMPALLVERGLVAATEALVDRIPLPTQLDLDPAELDASAGALPPAVASTGYLIVAEAVANAVKHAAATGLRVRIARDDGHLLLEVRDDGVGGAEPTGSGLRGIQDRVEAAEGTMRLTSPPGGGTHLVVGLPCGS